MSDTDKLAEAMKELAMAIKQLAEKLPNQGLCGYTVYHQHSYPAIPQPRFGDPYQSPRYDLRGGGNQC